MDGLVLLGLLADSYSMISAAAAAFGLPALGEGPHLIEKRVHELVARVQLHHLPSPGAHRQ